MLLLWHHLFLNAKNYTFSLFYFSGVPIESVIAQFCKCCVAIFMFLSGYGLFISYTSFTSKTEIKSPLKADIVFIKNRVLKLMSNYWFVFIIFVPLGLFFGRKFYEVYGNNPLHYLANLFGLSYLFYKDEFTMNPTWWYVSEILLFYAIYPLMYRIYKKINVFLLIITVGFCLIPGVFRGLNIYLCTLVLGTVFADRKLFEKYASALKNKVLAVIIPLVAFVPLCVVRYFLNAENMVYAMKFDTVFIVPILFLSYILVSKIPYVSSVLEELGRKSGFIFLFHTFLFGYYFKSFFYSFKYPILIFAALLIISYITAFIFEWLMKITKYKDIFKKITS